MTSIDEKPPRVRMTTRLVWVFAAALCGLVVGLILPVLSIIVFPNEKPQALLKQGRLQGRVGDFVVLDASSSKVADQPDARLRFEWTDPDNRFLLPAGVDAEGASARLLTVYGTAPGEREIVLRVTNTSRCHRLAKFAIPMAYCEVSDETRARIDFRPDCKPGPGLPADELVLDGARVIGVADLNAECRLILPKLTVTNGFRLEIRENVPLETPAGGSRIIAFRSAAPNGGAGAAGVDPRRVSDGQPGMDGGIGAPGQVGESGRDSGPIMIVAFALHGQLDIENAGQPGGRGGIGGRGGQGGRGGNTLMASINNCDRLIEAQPGGKGGAGGPGGSGGRGGNAGPVRIELAIPIVAPNALTISADGGLGGTGGPTGYPGRGGKGGFGVTRTTCPPASDAPDASAGESGAAGPVGQAGSPAAITVRDGPRNRDQAPGPRTVVRLPSST